MGACILCRHDWLTPYKSIRICYICMKNLTGNEVDIATDFGSVSFLEYGSMMKKISYNDFDFSYDHNTGWKGFYCGGNKWIIPEWYYDEDAKHMFIELIVNISLLCSSKENVMMDKNIDKLLQFLENKGIYLLDNIHGPEIQL